MLLILSYNCVMCSVIIISLLVLTIVSSQSQADPQDSLPWSNLTHLAELEQAETFTMKVFVLTMNRPESLKRLLDSISNTFFEYEEDKIELEIHVDKSHGM